jgi:hypothetical protein
VSKVHSLRKEVRDAENVPDLGSSRARHISTEEDRRFLEVRNLTRKGAEIFQNSANVGRLNNRGRPTKDEIICKKEGVNWGQPVTRVTLERLELSR